MVKWNTDNNQLEEMGYVWGTTIKLCELSSEPPSNDLWSGDQGPERRLCQGVITPG